MLTTIIHFWDSDDAVATGIVERYLEEGARRHDMGQGRSMIFHRMHIPDSKDHLHFFLKKNQLYALNRDGTAHDQSHGRQMHRWAMDAIKQHYPDFTIPPKGTIESGLLTASVQMLVESQILGQPLVSSRLMRTALNLATLSGA